MLYILIALLSLSLPISVTCAKQPVSISRLPNWRIEIDVPAINKSSHAKKLISDTATAAFLEIADTFPHFASMSGAIELNSTSFTFGDHTSIRLDLFVAPAKAAHPFNAHKTLTFESETAKPLILADIVDDHQFYSAVSAYSYQELEKRLKSITQTEKEMLKSGTKLDEENLKLWNISKEGFHVTFAPYTVGTRVAGTQEVIIPWKELNTFLKPQFKKEIQ